MKKALVLLLIGGLVAAAAWWLWPVDKAPDIAEVATRKAPRDSLSARAIPNNDLPPEGTRSLFDHIIKDNGALPYPFEDLVALIASYDAQSKAPPTVLIPDGRSLLKAHADYEKPRIVTAADTRSAASANTLDPMLRGRLFLGFVEAADEIEVISYNEAAGRFEFQLVEDYKRGGVPKIVYARRTICTTCHANQAPIFPVRPWDETNANHAVAARIEQARGNAEPYHSAPVSVPLATVDAIDGFTDTANVVPTTQRIWIDGCGEDTQCRGLMLKLALRFAHNPGAFDPDGADAKALIALQRESWPAEGIALADNDLRNRQPLADDRGLRLFQRAQRLFTSAEDELDAFSELPPLPRRLDPLTPHPPKAVLRADSLEGVYGIAQMFSENDLRLLESHSGNDVTKLETATQDAAVDPLLAPEPFSRVATMHALLTALGLSELPEYCCVDAEGMSPPQAAGVKPLEISQGSVLELYEQYCFACHRGNPNAELDFMSGDTEAEVLERIKTTPEIADVLDYERYLGSSKENKLMPPADSYQREELDAARGKNKNHAKQMAKIIPSLFDF